MTARTGIIMAVTAAAMSFAAPTTAAAQSAQVNTVAVTPGGTQGLTEAQCKEFKGLFTGYIKDVGRANLSDDFVNAMVEFAITKKCAAPASIPTTAKDLDVFNAMELLFYRAHGISLKKMGIVPVAP